MCDTLNFYIYTLFSETIGTHLKLFWDTCLNNIGTLLEKTLGYKLLAHIWGIFITKDAFLASKHRIYHKSIYRIP